MSVDQDIWKIVAEKCCYTHQLRTVRNVARDLATLQSLCKSLTTCASSAWREAAKLCQDGWIDYEKQEATTLTQLRPFLPAKSVTADEVLQQVIKLHPAQLQVFNQIQRDKAATVFAKDAKATYHLADGDLKHLVPKLTHNRYRPSAPCRLYKQQDVIDLAEKKWGGLEGFQQITSKRQLVQAKRKATKEAKYAASDEGKAEQARLAAEHEAAEALSAAAPAREQALQASLAKHGLQHEHGFRPYKDYLRRGLGDPDQIALQAAHLKWLFANTDVRARMEQEWETEGVSPLDPVWHGMGLGGDDEQQYHNHEPEPLSLDRMSGASARARQKAMEQWYNEHRASPADLQGVPADLLHMVVR